MREPTQIDGARPSGDSTPPLNREQGHAFKNIFSIILANAELIGEEGEHPAPLQRRLARIIEAARRGEELVGRLRHAGAVASETAPVGGPQPIRRSGQVLVVDDEIDVVEIICRFLHKAGLEALGTTDPGRALELFAADPLAFALVITDLDMPKLSGAELCQRLNALRPDVPILMITGYDRQVSENPGAYLGVRELLTKPLARETFLKTVQRILSA